MIRILMSVAGFGMVMCAVVGTALTPRPVRAQCEPLEDKLTASDGIASAQFGYAVAIDGAVAVVGAWLADPQGTDSGAAYVYRFNGSSWAEEATLTAADGVPYDLFGSAVAVSGNLIVIGAAEVDSAGYNSNAGAAYVFRRIGSNWVQEAKLLPNDGQPNDHFGVAVSASGNMALIGASGDDDGGSNSGAAYLFVHDGSAWQQEAKLLAPNPGGFDHFGNSVGLSGERAVIGAHLHFNDAGLRSGAAYVFRKEASSWAVEAMLEASDAAGYDYFGFSVAIADTVVAVGAYQDDDNGSDSGSAYLFRYDGSAWVQEDKVVSADGVPNDYFGYAVAVSGGQLVGGAYSNGWPGAAYLFGNDAGNWTQMAKLAPSDWGMNDYFGAAVGLSGGVAIIGAHHDDDMGLSSGSAYLYSSACDPPAGCSSAADCDDDDPCTTDSCEGGDCLNVPLDCSDGNACTADSCAGGSCVHDMVCDCLTHADCNDDNACTTDSCLNNSCVHQAVGCSDGDACTMDSCNSASGCQHQPLSCDDGNSCTADSCSAGGCVHDFICECLTPADCDDFNACTSDSCVGNSCVHQGIGCNDGNACTVDSCNSTTGCQHQPLDCDDGDACTTDSCSAGACVHDFICECSNDAGCGDGNACTDDRCINGSCVHDFICDCGSDAECNDGDSCTIDVCAGGTCEHDFVCECMNGADCNDGDVCTADSCVGGSCVHDFICECNSAADCNDANACTSDYCSAGSCAHVALSCNDGDACTTDSCAPASGCVHSTVNCEDGDPCTMDGCDPLSGCYHDVLVTCCGNGVCEASEDCSSCTADCSSSSAATICGNGVCEPGEDCLSCDQDCNGKQNGSPVKRFCCSGDGAGGGDNPVGCEEAACNSAGFQCGSVDPSCCGDGFCEAGEAPYNCALDCGEPGTCGDGTCNPGEDCTNCSGDCAGKLNGPRAGRFCCGNGVIEGPESAGRCDGNP